MLSGRKVLHSGVALGKRGNVCLKLRFENIREYFHGSHLSGKPEYNTSMAIKISL